MRDNTGPGLAFKLGTNAPRWPRPVVGMRCAVDRSARSHVSVTPTVTYAAERGVRPMTSAWRAYGTLPGLIFLAAFAFRFSGGYCIAGRGTRHQCFQQGTWSEHSVAERLLIWTSKREVASSIPAFSLFEQPSQPAP